MAIIKCPGCKRRVSNMSTVCPNCGYGIRDREAGLSLQEAERRWRRRARYSLQMQSYWGLVATAAGLGWMWFDVHRTASASKPSIFLGAAGALWYIAMRLRMILLKRRG